MTAGLAGWGAGETETVASLPQPLLSAPGSPAKLEAAQRPQQGLSRGHGVSTWSKEHRLDAGGVEDADDCMPGTHPPAAHIPIGACQVLCVQETFL